MKNLSPANHFKSTGSSRLMRISLLRISLLRVFKTITSWVRLRRPVIQANGRLTFEDDLRSGGLLCFISMNASLPTVWLQRGNPENAKVTFFHQCSKMQIIRIKNLTFKLVFSNFFGFSD